MPMIDPRAIAYPEKTRKDGDVGDGGTWHDREFPGLDDTFDCAITAHMNVGAIDRTERAAPLPMSNRALRDWAWLPTYALGFYALHQLAAIWGDSGFYSLWYPAAGLRFAVLWRRGARATGWIVLTELAVQLVTGVITAAGADWAQQAWSIMRPGIGYGLAVGAVQHLAARARDARFATPPMPLGLACAVAPFAAMALSLPTVFLRPDFTRVGSPAEIVGSLAALTVGDLLGVLMVAPPLLWLADAIERGQRPTLTMPRVTAVIEGSTVLTIALGLVWALYDIGLGRPTTPVLLAVAWIGLRFGRAAAWSAILVTALVVLPHTAGLATLDSMLALHMGLSAVAVVGYLAGSFADADIRARADLARRDRLLFQAERLKTLRAMSVAVIHEISQPLSTLAIEARHLAGISASPLADPGEVHHGAQLIERKAIALATLVRRLRRFGGRAVDNPSPLPVAALLDTVAALVQPEARAAGVVLAIDPGDLDLVVFAQEVELAQAIINLVRNAIQATPDRQVGILAERLNGAVRIRVTNARPNGATPTDGMGVGLLVARTIIEAHGGHLRRVDQPEAVAQILTLPLAEEVS